MNMPTKEHISRDRKEEAIDKSIEDTFPASDPPAAGGVTKIVPDERDPDDTADKAQNHER